MSRARAVGVALLALAGAGCPPDLSDYRIAGRDGDAGDGGGATDSAVEDGAPPRDGGGADAGDTLGGPCGTPQLLMTMENLRVDGESGRVLRYEIGETLPFRRCGDLSGRGAVGAQPWGVAVVGGVVAVATWNGGRDGLVGVDPETDAELWYHARTDVYPSDVFALFHPGPDRDHVAVAWASPSTQTIVREIQIIDPMDGGLRRTWRTNDMSGGVMLPLGLSVPSITRSPVNRERLLVLKTTTGAAVEVDPWTETAFEMPAYVRPADGVALHTISAGEYMGTLNRVVWTGSTGGGAAGVYYVNDMTGTGPLSPSLVRTCRNRTCDLVHAVPDLTTNLGFFALCDESGEIARDVVRFSSVDEDCETIVDGGTLGERTRISKLAVHMGGS